MPIFDISVNTIHNDESVLSKTHEESSDVAIWLKDALSGWAGFATAIAAPACRPVEMTCSTTRAPAAISAILVCLLLLMVLWFSLSLFRRQIDI